MTLESKYMMALFKCAINGGSIPPPPDSLDWLALYNTADDQRIAPIIYSVVSGLPDGSGPDRRLMERWKSVTAGLGVIAMKQAACFKEVLDAARENDIHLLTFKGLELSSLYPNPLTRAAVDADILVAPKDIPRLHAMLRGMGYIRTDPSGTNETSFFNNTLKLEIHTCLWENHGNSRYDILSGFGFCERGSHMRLKAMGIESWVMDPRQGITYLMYHTIKHFFLSGIGVRYVSDISLFCNRYGSDIDWPLFWSQMGQLGYTGFCLSFFHICQELFGLPEAVFAAAPAEADGARAALMMDDMLKGGHNGHALPARGKASNILSCYYRYETRERSLPGNRLFLLLAIFMPSAVEKRSPLLRIWPILWINRIIKRLKQGKNAKSSSIPERIETARKRLELMDTLGLR